MKKILSYFIPVKRSYYSAISGRLDVVMVDGKKYLDSPGANYSYGSLQEVLEWGLDELGTEGCNEILLLGLGGGSVIDSLYRKRGYSGVLDAVDIDPVIIEVADKEFNIRTDARVQVYQNDAVRYLKQVDSKYDLAIIDLFVDRTVPDFCMTRKFWALVSERLSRNAKILFNTMEQPEEALSQVVSYLKDLQFTVRSRSHPVYGNLLLLACRE